VSDIRVAVVDDSSFLRKAVARMMMAEPDIELVGLASKGEELLENLEIWRPDAIILDLSMPGIGGLATLDEIMARRPVPVVILSTHSRQGAPQTIEALHRGAVDFLDKQQFSLVDFDAIRHALAGKIREVAGGAQAAVAAVEPVPGRPAPERRPAPDAGRPPELILIGASTGGPLAIETVLRDLGPAVPAPILVVQHMPAGFTRAFADRLNLQLPLAVREAVHGEGLQAATAYIAPGGLHLKVGQEQGRLACALGLDPAGQAHRPSVDVLFTSAAEAGARSVAVLLTGMGHDGAAGMARLARQGALTIAQDEATSVVYGMPRAALAAGGAREVLPLADIGARVRRLWDDPERMETF
jgi:two-component system chemotaxis response regulator CheB